MSEKSYYEVVHIEFPAGVDIYTCFREARELAIERGCYVRFNVSGQEHTAYPFPAKQFSAAAMMSRYYEHIAKRRMSECEHDFVAASASDSHGVRCLHCDARVEEWADAKLWQDCELGFPPDATPVLCQTKASRYPYVAMWHNPDGQGYFWELCGFNGCATAPTPEKWRRI